MVATPTAAVAALALVGGAAAGVGLERADLFSPLAEPEPAVVLTDRVPVLDCPDGTLVAGLTRGDRVLATGRSDDGAWIEIRSPVNLDQPAWLAAGALQGDRSLDDLPVHECERTGPTTTSTSTTSTSSTSTTSTTSSTTTTAPEPTTTTSSTTTTSTSTTSTTRLNPPSVRRVTLGSSTISEHDPAAPGECGRFNNDLPESTDIVAEIAGEATRVTFAYSIGGGGEMSPFQAGTRWTGTIGPFPFLEQDETSVDVTVTAVGPGGTDTFGPTSFTLVPCQGIPE